MTTNREIDGLLGPSSYTYRGTYASDFLPRRNFTSFPTSLIINLCKHNIQEEGRSAERPEDGGGGGEVQQVTGVETERHKKLRIAGKAR